MVLPLAPILGAASALPGVISSFAGLFDNSVNERNKARVNAINQRNQQILGDNLKIRSDFINRQTNVKQNIDFIQLAANQARGRAQLGLDRATNEALRSNQRDIVKMFQALGNREGTMNVGNRQALLDYSANATERAAQLTGGRDDFVTSQYSSRIANQNAISNELARVRTPPQYKQYIQGYTPEQDNMGQKILGAVGGLAGAAMTGFETYDKFKVPTDLDGFNPGMFNTGVEFNPDAFGIDAGFGNFSPQKLKIGNKLNPAMFTTGLGYGGY
jgi:hypothetical protein|tara:strand:- start:579 stop:1397 length:819 start_codon:yes stop_codon:yes gene_type:complete